MYKDVKTSVRMANMVLNALKIVVVKTMANVIPKLVNVYVPLAGQEMYVPTNVQPVVMVQIVKNPVNASKVLHVIILAASVNVLPATWEIAVSMNVPAICLA